MSKYTEAAKQADWQQVIFNGGPPCFHLEEDGSFCLRAERWAGHKATPGFHGFVSLAALIAELEAEVDGLQKRIGNEFMKRAEHHFVEKDRENALLRKALEDLLSDCDTDEWRLAVVNAKAALARNTKEK